MIQKMPLDEQKINRMTPSRKLGYEQKKKGGVEFTDRAISLQMSLPSLGRKSDRFVNSGPYIVYGYHNLEPLEVK